MEGKRRTNYGLFTHITGKAGKLWRVWSKRDLKMAKRLRKKIKRLGISYDMVGLEGIILKRETAAVVGSPFITGRKQGIKVVSGG
jgi:hypothetical protein